MPKVSFASALPVGTESMHETVDIELCEILSTSLVRAKVTQQLPNGIKILDLEDITHHRKKLTLEESHFHITMDGLRVEQTALDRFLQSESFPVSKTRKGKEN